MNFTPPDYFFLRCNISVSSTSFFLRATVSLRSGYSAFPVEITVYRGIRGSGILKSLSLTTDMAQAEWFAKRWDKNGKAYSATVDKEDVLEIFALRGESEVVEDVTKLRNIRLERE